MARIEQEEEKAKQRSAARKASAGGARRFYVPVGDSKSVIIVDERITFVRQEHTIKGPSGKFDTHTACINEYANCPVCLAYPDKQSYFAAYLTVIDLTPFTTSTGEEVEWSKKLLVIKQAQQKKMMRMYQKYGTLRGLQLTMSRDGEKEAAIGNDWQDDGFVEEDDLLAYVNEYTNSDGKKVEILGYEPFDYEAILPEQTEQQLSALVGGSGRTTRQDNDRAVGRGRPAPRAREETGDDWEEERRPARAVRGAPAARPAARPAVRRPADPVEEEYEEAAEPEAEEAPPPRLPVARTAAAPSRPSAPARPAARPRLQEPDEEEAPPVSRESMAERRRAIRGR